MCTCTGLQTPHILCCNSVLGTFRLFPPPLQTKTLSILMHWLLPILNSVAESEPESRPFPSTLCVCHQISTFTTPMVEPWILMVHFPEPLHWDEGHSGSCHPSPSSAEAHEEGAGEALTPYKSGMDSDSSIWLGVFWHSKAPFISSFHPAEQGLTTLSRETKQKVQIQLKRSQKEVRHKECSRNPRIDFFFHWQVIPTSL